MCRLERSGARGDAGFSLVELVMALMVLAFGVLGLATTTLLVTREITVAQITTGRTTALRSAMERIRATPYDSVGSGGDTIGFVTVSWTSTSATGQTKTVEIVSVGPGLARASAGQPPMLSDNVTDTVMYTVLRP